MNNAMSVARRQHVVGIVRESAKEMGGLRQFGVTLRTMVKIVEQFGLSQEEINNVLAVKQEYKGSISKIRGLLDSGASTEEIGVLYEVRRLIQDGYQPDDKRKWNGVSLVKLHEFCRAFQICFDEDSAQSIFELISELHDEIKSIPHYRWIRSVDGTISVLVAISQDHHRVADPRSIVESLSRMDWSDEGLNDE